MADRYFYKINATDEILSSGLKIIDSEHESELTGNAALSGISETKVSAPIIGEFSIPIYKLDPNAAETANITTRTTAQIQSLQKWKDAKKRKLRTVLNNDFDGQEENKYHTLKAQKADGAGLGQPELDFLTNFESWRTARLATYETDKTDNGIT